MLPDRRGESIRISYTPFFMRSHPIHTLNWINHRSLTTLSFMTFIKGVATGDSRMSSNQPDGKPASIHNRAASYSDGANDFDHFGTASASAPPSVTSLAARTAA